MNKHHISKRDTSKHLSRKKRDRDPMELCLCPCCANQFFSSPYFYVERTDPYQVDKDICTFCNYRRGYDFSVYSLVGRFAYEGQTSQSAQQQTRYLKEDL